MNWKFNLTFLNFNFKTIVAGGSLACQLRELTYFLIMSNIISLSTNNTQITFQKAIVNDYEQEVYNARTLHTLLESKQQFADWIKNRLQDFVENVDFVSLSDNYEKPLGGRPTKDFLLTINTAKHISMLERNEQGLKMRQAFIDAEKQLRKIQQQVPQLQQLSRLEILEIAIESEKRAIAFEKEKLALENTVKHKDIVIEQQDATIDKITNIQDTYSLRQAKGNLHVEEKALKEYLFAKKWFQYLSNGKSGTEKKNIMQATYYAVKNNFAKDVNVGNKTQQRFFKQFRITKHGMAFLIKHRNEFAK